MTLTSVVGTFRTWRNVRSSVAIGGIADTENWIAPRSLSSGAHSRDPWALNDEKIHPFVIAGRANGSAQSAAR